MQIHTAIRKTSDKASSGVLERLALAIGLTTSTTRTRNYYANSPKVDPTGPSQGGKSHFAYEVTVPRDHPPQYGLAIKSFNLKLESGR